jgi:hypothetical protein
MTMPNTLTMVPRLALGRLATGLAQGAALYLLYRVGESGAWPASQALVFAPLLMIAWFIPLILLVGLGDLRPRAMLAWVAGAAVAVTGLALHDVARGAEGGGEVMSWIMGGRRDLAIWPSPGLVLAAAAGIFIAQSLIAAGDAERRIVAPYPAYFDAAWTAAVRLALSAVFVALFWLLLLLGAGLFKLIDITFFETLIGHRWFAMPATTLALAVALQVTDARAGVVRGLRVLIHVLLSWLLPLLALVVAGFLASLPFTSLAPLWRTGFATGLLLLTAAALIVLVNAAYEDGDPARRPVPALRHAGSLAALTLVPLVAIAAYALGLRIGQYGWSGERVAAAAALVVAACHALGYAAAALWPGAWLKRIEAVNVAASVVILAVLLALFSPLADPARIAVASQVARLEAGLIPPDQFDYAYLRFDGARYGKAALERLASIEGPNASVIRERVAAAQRMKDRLEPHFEPPTAQEMAASITVHPRGRALPESFLAQDWLAANELWYLPHCLLNRSDQCDAFLIDLAGDGTEDIVVVEAGSASDAAAFHESGGRWRLVGTFTLSCASVRSALNADQFKAVAPQWRDLDVAGTRLHLSLTDQGSCS